MSHADHHARPAAVFGQGKSLVMLRSQGDIADQPIRGFLIPFKLLHIGLRYGFRRLGSLIIHIQIGAFKMYAKDLCALIAFPHHGGDIFQRGRQHLRHLRHRGGQDRGHALFGDPPHPVSQSLRFRVVGVKTVCAVGMYIDKTRQDPSVPVILIRGKRPPGEHILYDPVLCHDLRGNKLARGPDSFTLYNHRASPAFSQISESASSSAITMASL